MRCYNHHDKDAVGTCKACGRGLCPTCAAEVEKAVACRDRCESDVSMLLGLNRNALQYARTAKQARYLAPTMFIVVGAMLVTLGVTYEGIDAAVFAGGVVTVIGIAFLVIQHRLAKVVRT
jgi:hypothetical protein